ncbi:sensor histidine kinase [Leifsonia poae]|uniref:histidine kinase n=1 Tax=Leifsonia poae TaxID=110933 RepID=A0A9W6HDQ4_9MICO|nr:histidine kinase [Leifsonia poae]GLJ77873.1 two-component sensor histidine kinase [Leifsonia poae]
MTTDPITPGRTASPAGGDLLLPRPPGAIRRFFAAHPVLVDALIAGVYLVPSLTAGIVAIVMEPSWQLAARLVLHAIAGAALFLRRQRPWAVFIVALVVMLAGVTLARDIDFVPALFALYALAVYRSARAAWIGFAAYSAATVIALTTGWLLAQVNFYTPLDNEPIASGVIVIVLALVWVLIGNNIGGRRRYLAALIDRAQQLARERDQQAVIAAAAERSRIAREMHDIVSHSLTVMVTLADGSAGLVATAPERSADAMRMVAETGRSALGDMRRLLGVLRATEGNGAEHAPQPGLGELGELVERFRAAGLPVRISVTGTPPTDTGQQLTVFRVVQEALTNALRYASLATTVEVSITFAADRISITVDDDATVRGTPGQGSGRGLLGLRERVGLYGGSLQAGPRAGRGWRLRAEFDALAPAAASSASSVSPPDAASPTDSASPPDSASRPTPPAPPAPISPRSSS